MSSAEDKAQRATVDKYWARWRAAAGTQNETDTLVGRTLLRSACVPLCAALEGWMGRAASGAGRRHSALDVFQVVGDPALLAVIILREVINGVTRERPQTSLAISIGTAIETEGRLAVAKSSYPTLIQALEAAQFSHRGDARQQTWILEGLRTIKGDVAPRLPRESRLRAGVVALELMEISTGLITSANVRQGKKLVRMVSASSYMSGWLEEAHGEAEFMTPLYPLLTHPPVRWSAPDVGGYVSLPLTLVKKGRADIYAPHDLSRVYSALNAHQETPYVVNEAVYDVMEYVWQRGLALGGLPSPELEPYPPKPADIDTNPKARKTYGRERNQIRSRNNAHKSKRLLAGQLLGIARAHIGRPLWQPACLDFRGRMYTIPAGLHTQGSDGARALLHFAKALPLKIDASDSSAAFLAYGASLYGVKGGTQELLDWVAHHKDELRYVGANPLENLMWCEAKRPWQFLAWAFEADEFWDSPASFQSQLPIAIDASSSGCQIWALLLRDERTAKATNVYPNTIPADLYQAVADKVLSKLESSDDPIARGWCVSGLVTRALTKPAVMIIPFSGTRVGLAQALYDKLQELKGTYLFTNEQKACYFLADQIKLATLELIPAVIKGMEWAREVSNICVEHGVAFEWVAPTGFPVVNDYRKPKYKKVRTALGSAYTTNLVQESSPRLSKRRCSQTIMANLTHSLDAAIACEAINTATDKYGISDISVIFDQFATHACNLDNLRKALLESVAVMFSRDEDYLTQVRNHLLTLLPANVELPEPPMVGDFDPTLVATSRHFAT